MRRTIHAGMLVPALALLFTIGEGCPSLRNVALAQTDSTRGSTGKVVALTAGTCVPVSSGDIITLDWNPAFDHAAIRGMRQIELAFARQEDREGVARVGAPLRLIASPRLHGEIPGQADPEIEDAGNGIFHVRFHPDLSKIEPGEYRLVGAQAYAHSTGNAQSPEMTNSPLRLPFCLNVVQASQRSR